MKNNYAVRKNIAPFVFANYANLTVNHGLKWILIKMQFCLHSLRFCIAVSGPCKYPRNLMTEITLAAYASRSFSALHDHIVFDE